MGPAMVGMDALIANLQQQHHQALTQQVQQHAAALTQQAQQQAAALAQQAQQYQEHAATLAQQAQQQLEQAAALAQQQHQEHAAAQQHQEIINRLDTLQEGQRQLPMQLQNATVSLDAPLQYPPNVAVVVVGQFPRTKQELLGT